MFAGHFHVVVVQNQAVDGDGRVVSEGVHQSCDREWLTLLIVGQVETCQAQFALF